MPQYFLLCLFWLCLSLSVAGCSQDSLPAGTVATVNGQPISLRMLNSVQALSYFERTAASDLSVEALRKQYGIALSSLIVHSLVTQELQKLGLEVPPDRLQTLEANIRADYPSGEFEQALLETQMDIQTWRELLYNQLALDLFAEKVLSRDIETSLVEILTYYAQNEKEFSYPASLYVRIISGADQAQVESARAALLATPDTLLPTGVLEQKTAMPKSSIPDEWRKDVEALKPGEISPVKKGAHQFQAVQLLEEMPANRMSVVEAYPLVEQAFFEQKIEERYADWIAQALQKANIRVSVYLLEQSASSGPEKK